MRKIAGNSTLQQQWLLRAGLEAMNQHWSLSLQDAHRTALRKWVMAASKREKSSCRTCRELEFVRPFPHAAVKELAGCLKFSDIERHLTRNYLVLLTEFHNMSTQILGYALTGDTTALESKDINKQLDPKSATKSVENPFDVGTISAMMPVLAPYNAVYGIATRIFFEQVAEVESSILA